MVCSLLLPGTLVLLRSDEPACTLAKESSDVDTLRACVQGPEDATGLWNVAVALAKREEHRSAHELAERALAAIRTTPNIPTLLGAAGLATAAGNHLRAIELFEAGIEQGLKLSKGELAEIFNRAAADGAESALQAIAETLTKHPGRVIGALEQLAQSFMHAGVMGPLLQKGVGLLFVLHAAGNFIEGSKEREHGHEVVRAVAKLQGPGDLGWNDLQDLSHIVGLLNITYAFMLADIELEADAWLRESFYLQSDSWAMGDSSKPHAIAACAAEEASRASVSVALRVLYLAQNKLTRAVLRINDPAALRWIGENCGIERGLESWTGEFAIATAEVLSIIEKCEQFQGIIASAAQNGGLVFYGEPGEWSALHAAAAIGSLPLLRIVIKLAEVELEQSNPKPLPFTPPTPLHVAVSGAFPKVAAALISKFGQDPLVRDPWGRTSIDVACLQRWTRQELVETFGDGPEVLCPGGVVAPLQVATAAHITAASGGGPGGGWIDGPVQADLATSGCGIDVEAGLSAETFASQYMATRRPVLVRGLVGTFFSPMVHS